MKLIKRKTYDGEDVYYQIKDTHYFLSEDRESLYLFEPHTEDSFNEDIELFEEEGLGSTWDITELDIKLLKQILEKYLKR